MDEKVELLRVILSRLDALLAEVRGLSAPPDPASTGAAGEGPGRPEEQTAPSAEPGGRAEERLDRLEAWMAQFERRMGRLEERVGRLEERVDRLHERLERLAASVSELPDEVNDGLERLDQRFAHLAKKWMEHDVEIARLKRREN